MREGMGLYKAKRIDNGKWVEGFFNYAHWINPTTRERVGTSYYILPLGQGDAFKVDPETVGQWTGLVDKNGVKIFEGDMVINCDDADEIGEIFWDDEDACFSAKFENVIFSFSNITEEYMEVIGNIHDKAVEE